MTNNVKLRIKIMDDNRTSDNSSVKNVLSQNFSSGPHGLGSVRYLVISLGFH